MLGLEVTENRKQTEERGCAEEGDPEQTRRMTSLTALINIRRQFSLSVDN